MIWRESSLWELGINYLLIIGYSNMSLICSLSGKNYNLRGSLYKFILSLCPFTVVSQMSRVRTAFIILSSMAIRQLCMDQLEPLISTIYNNY